MSKDSDANNPFVDDPYRSPQAMDQPAIAGSPAAVRPGALTAICVLAIILGSLGLLFACFGVGGLLLQDQLSELGATGRQSPSDKQLEEIQKTINEVQKKYTTVNLAVTVVHFPVAILLIVGGIQALKLRAGGRKMLFAALIGALVFEVARGVVTAIVQVATIGAANVEIRKLSGGNSAAMFQTIMYLTIGCTGALLLAKLILYGWAATYVNKPSIRSLYEPHLDNSP